MLDQSVAESSTPASNESQGKPSSGGRPRKRRHTAPRPDALAYSFSELQQMGGPGRTKGYALVKEGVLEMIKIGRHSRLTGNSVRRFLGAQEAA